MAKEQLVNSLKGAIKSDRDILPTESNGFFTACLWKREKKRKGKDFSPLGTTHETFCLLILMSERKKILVAYSNALSSHVHFFPYSKALVSQLH